MMRFALMLPVALLATPALARPSAYQHKAGAVIEEMAADQTTCWNDGMKAMNDPKFQNPWILNPATESTAAGAAGGAFARGMADGLAGGKRFKLTFHDCMIAKGYTHRRPTDADWKAYKALKKPERLKMIQGWATASEPVHPVAPRNEFD